MRILKMPLNAILYAVFLACFAMLPYHANAQNNDLPWGKSKEPSLITPDRDDDDRGEDSRRTPLPSQSESYTPSRRSESYRSDRNPLPQQDRGYERRSYDRGPVARDRYERRDSRDRYPADRPVREETYSDDEILDAGHRFFGKVSKGLAKVIARAFKSEGRPNAYILGEEAGGAFVAGLKYGEGTMVTKHFGRHKVYWQGPSIGYDFGAEGSKTMILVYDLRHPNDIYHKFAGVNGSAYLVGGIGLTFQKHNEVVLARIQSGLGLRLGANVGYLKYTRRPTWNPF